MGNNWRLGSQLRQHLQQGGRKLNEISSLFTEEFISDIPGDETNPSTGRLDPALMKEFFNNGLANYCQLMLGEECPPVKGCGFNDLCGSDESCRNDNSTLGFKCIPGITLYPSYYLKGK